MTTDGFADRFNALENKIGHLKRSRALSRSEPKLAEEFVKDLGTLRHDVSKLIKARKKIITEVALRFTMVADRLGRVGARIAIVPVNAQLPNNRVCPQKD